MTSVAPVGGVKRSLCIKSRALMRPSVLMKKPAGSECHPARPGICRRKHLVLLGSPGDPLHGSTSSLRGREALLRVQIKARKATLGARVPSELPTRCWCLLLGQERVAVGFHLFQSLHEVAVAHLKLLCFVQCRSKLSLEFPFLCL